MKYNQWCPVPFPASQPIIQGAPASWGMVRAVVRRVVRLQRVKRVHTKRASLGKPPTASSRALGRYGVRGHVDGGLVLAPSPFCGVQHGLSCRARDDPTTGASAGARHTLNCRRYISSKNENSVWFLFSCPGPEPALTQLLLLMLMSLLGRPSGPLALSPFLYGGHLWWGAPHSAIGSPRIPLTGVCLVSADCPVAWGPNERIASPPPHPAVRPDGSPAGRVL